MENKEKQNTTNKAEEKNDAETPLFRKEALHAKKGSYFGKTLIVASLSFSVWALGLFVIAVAIGLFLYFGEYAKRQIVQGVLIPDTGLMTVYAKNPGIVVNKFVHQGEEVKKGQLLYLISTEQEALTEQSLSAQQITLLEKQIEVQKKQNCYV